MLDVLVGGWGGGGGDDFFIKISAWEVENNILKGLIIRGCSDKRGFTHTANVVALPIYA